MNVRAVLIPLCVLFTQAPCNPAGSRAEAVNQTISLALKKIRIARGHLDDSLPDVSCSSLNVTEHVGLTQEPLSARRLSTVHCYLQELSKLTPEVSEMLLTAAQFIKDVGKLLNSDSTAPQSCNLHEFKEAPDAYEFAKCFLELVLEERPSKTNL